MCVSLCYVTYPLHSTPPSKLIPIPLPIPPKPRVSRVIYHDAAKPETVRASRAKCETRHGPVDSRHVEMWRCN